MCDIIQNITNNFQAWNSTVYRNGRLQSYYGHHKNKVVSKKKK